MRIRALALAAAGSLTLTTAALAATRASAADGAQLSVLHAVKGQTVDVYANGGP